MAAFKRLTIAVALLGLALSSVPVAQAQFNFPVQPLGRINCVYSAVPNQVRAEGLAERTGDARLDCTNDGIFNPFGGNQIEQYVSTNITLRLNTAVTNRLDVGDDGSTVTDSVMVINDNNHFDPIDDSDFPSGACTTVGPSGFEIPDVRFPCPMKGRISGSTQLVWDDVQFPVPGAPNDPLTLPTPNGDGVPICTDIFNQEDSESCFNVTTTIRITNIRGNAAAVGEGSSITGTLSIFSFASIGVTPNNTQTLALVDEGLIVDFGSPVTGLQCETFSGHTSINLQEGFAGAFKTLGAPTFTQSDFAAENGYPVCENGSSEGDGTCSDPQDNAGTGGGATQATRFMIRFVGVQPGVVVTVHDAVDEGGERGSDCPVTVSGGPLCVERVSGTDENGAGGSAVGGGDDYDVSLDSDGNGFVVYELKDGDPFMTQDIDIPIWVSWTPDTEVDEPAIGSSSVLATFAPLSDDGSAGNSPTPRFIDDSGDPATFVTVVRCSTTLLFPFVSNRFGFDTGLAISNTSMDWKGTAPQQGRCMIHYIGTTGDDGPMPPDDLSGEILGGEQVTWTLSMGNDVWLLNGAPDFQGFVVAMCEFQFAHGYAFITDATSAIPNFAQGYLALILQFDVDEDGDVVRVIGCTGDQWDEHACRSEALNQ
jgi:hypothetical protein